MKSTDEHDEASKYYGAVKHGKEIGKMYLVHVRSIDILA